MTKKHSTKKALMASALSLLLCFTMLLGTTFAWFTDSVTSANNIIKSGTLDVEMYWAEGKDAVPTTDAGWTDASQGAIFDYDKWEPGYAVVRHIKIANKGSLALKYKVRIAANGEVSNLSDVIDVYYLDPAAQIADRTALVAEKKIGTLTEVLEALDATGEGELIAGASDTITIAFKMQESAGNEYQNKSIGSDFSIQLVATQLASEDDSFNNQYDKDATYPLVSVPATLPSDPADVAVGHKFETEHAEVTVGADILKDIVKDTEAESLAISHSEPKIDATANTVTFDNFDIVDENNKPVDLKALGNTTPITVKIDLKGAIATGKTVVVYHDSEVIASAVVDADGCITYTTTHFCEVVAAVGGGEVNNALELNAAIANGESVSLKGDLTVSSTIVIPEGTTVVIDLNGYTINTAYAEGSTTNHVYAFTNNGNLLLKNGTVNARGIFNYGNMIIENATINAIDGNGGYAIRNYSGSTLTMNSGKIATTLEDDHLSDAGGYDATTLRVDAGASAVINGGTIENICDFTSAIENYGTVVVNDAKITAIHTAVYNKGTMTFNGGSVSCGMNGTTRHTIYNVGGKTAINGGTFINTATDQNATGASVINGNVEVNGGTFSGRIENYSGTPVINGGTFSVDPARFVKGYQVINNGDGTWTVDEYKVSTGAELVDAIANGKAVELTQDVTLGKIDLTDAITNDVVIDANGHKITTADAYGIEVTAGKNVTISNANVEMTKAGDYITYAAGFKIANGDYAGATITLENCTITMANTDWAYAVNMPASVKNLNLVINNCTLEGAVAVQCWGDNNTITITNSKLICNYTTNALYTSYCVVLQAEGSNVSENNTLVIDNCEFQYSGVDNFNSQIYSVEDRGNGNTGNTVTVTNCTYGEKVVAD